MTKKFRSERGEVTVGSALGLFVLAFLVYELFQFWPPLAAQFQFQDACVEIAKFSVHTRDPNSVRAQVINKGQELGIPLTVDQVAVVRQATYTRIQVNYELSANWLPGTPYKWKASVDEESRVF